MRVVITVTQTVRVVIDGKCDPFRRAIASGSPLDDLIERMRREMQYGRDSVQWRNADGPKVT